MYEISLIRPLAALYPRTSQHNESPQNFMNDATFSVSQSDVSAKNKKMKKDPQQWHRTLSSIYDGAFRIK